MARFVDPLGQLEALASGIVMSPGPAENFAEHAIASGRLSPAGAVMAPL